MFVLMKSITESAFFLLLNFVGTSCANAAIHVHAAVIPKFYPMTHSSSELETDSQHHQGQHITRPKEHVESGSKNANATDASQRRTATVYDAVAGRVGLNGFLNQRQLTSEKIEPLTPAEVLLRRVNAPREIPYDYYDASSRLNSRQQLPESDLLKDIHAYAADFYQRRTEPDDKGDFQSLDETALLAMGVLLEEACKECLGQTGDMVFTEAQSRDRQAQLSSRQIIGRVVPETVQEYQSSSDSDDANVRETQPRKRQRRRYQDFND